MNQKLRDDMMILKGMIEASKFPLVWSTEIKSQAYYDLIDSVCERYDSILKQLINDFNNN